MCACVGWLAAAGMLGILARASGSVTTADARQRGSVPIADVEGRLLRPFEPAGVANVIFFVTSDCPISNSYAPEIQRVCRDYGSRGVGCILAYEDVDMSSTPSRMDAQVRAHLGEYRYDGIPAVVDRARVLAKQAGASITPEAAIVDRAGALRYRGRIDNFYAALGKPRQQVTERDLRDALDAVLANRPVVTARTQALGCHIVDPALLKVRK